MDNDTTMKAARILAALLFAVATVSIAACTSLSAVDVRTPLSSATVMPSPTHPTSFVTPTAPLLAVPPTHEPDTSAKIVFSGTTRDIRNPNIYTMNADGSHFLKLTDNWNLYTDFTEARWSPDGARIMFVMRQEGSDSEIAVINADGSGLRMLTVNTVNDYQPTWSPDGQHVAFVSRGSGVVPRVQVMRQDGGETRPLTRGDDAYMEHSPEWSPSGDQIAFVAQKPSDSWEESHLRIANLDGSGERRLTSGDRAIDDPRWSPDGKWIAYMIWRPGIWFNLVSADGARLLEPRAEGVQDFLYPVWSPDAKRVAFAVIEESSPDVTSLAVMDIATQKWRKLVEGVDTWARCWLPDGRHIMYRSGDALWVIQDDGSSAHLVAEGMGMSDCFPHYSRQ